MLQGELESTLGHEESGGKNWETSWKNLIHWDLKIDLHIEGIR